MGQPCSTKPVSTQGPCGSHLASSYSVNVKRCTVPAPSGGGDWRPGTSCTQCKRTLQNRERTEESETEGKRSYQPGLCGGMTAKNHGKPNPCRPPSLPRDLHHQCFFASGPICASFRFLCVRTLGKKDLRSSHGCNVKPSGLWRAPNLRPLTTRGLPVASPWPERRRSDRRGGSILTNFCA